MKTQDPNKQKWETRLDDQPDDSSRKLKSHPVDKSAKRGWWATQQLPQLLPTG